MSMSIVICNLVFFIKMRLFGFAIGVNHVNAKDLLGLSKQGLVELQV